MGDVQMESSENNQPAVAEKKWCFVISPIGDPGTDINKRANDVLDYIIIPAAKACGYEREMVKRADKMEEPGIISSQVVASVVNAPLVIADLTGHNPNVFYELALRHAIKKPIVQIIHRSDRLPFDVNQQRTIFYDHQDLRLTNETTIPAITAQINAVESNPDLVDNPITVAMDLQALRESGDVNQEMVATLYSTVANLQRTVEGIASSNGARPTGGSQASERLTPFLKKLLKEAKVIDWRQGATEVILTTADGLRANGATFERALDSLRLLRTGESQADIPESDSPV